MHFFTFLKRNINLSLRKKKSVFSRWTLIQLDDLSVIEWLQKLRILMVRFKQGWKTTFGSMVQDYVEFNNFVFCLDESIEQILVQLNNFQLRKWKTLESSV